MLRVIRQQHNREACTFDWRFHSQASSKENRVEAFQALATHDEGGIKRRKSTT